MNVIAQVLSAVLVLVSVATIVAAVIRARRLTARVDSRPDGRVWFYRRFILRMWAMAALVPAIAWSSRDLTGADLGWVRPHGHFGYVIASFLALALLVAGVRARRRLRRGIDFPARRRIVFMVPRTPRERWWALALSITAGVTEELIYRGALIGIGTKVYQLPFLAAAVAALLLFAAAHLYQGWRGVLGAAAAGYLYTLIYALSGSLVLPILGHIIQDVVTLLLVPGEPTPRTATPPGLARHEQAEEAQRIGQAELSAQPVPAGATNSTPAGATNSTTTVGRRATAVPDASAGTTTNPAPGTRSATNPALPGS